MRHRLLYSHVLRSPRGRCKLRQVISKSSGIASRRSQAQIVQRTPRGRRPVQRPSNTTDCLARGGSRGGLLTGSLVSNRGSHRRTVCTSGCLNSEGPGQRAGQSVMYVSGRPIGTHNEVTVGCLTVMSEINGRFRKFARRPESLRSADAVLSL